MDSLNKHNVKEGENIIDNFTNLAPVSDGKNQKVYIELLKKGIDDKEVKNIALSGSYGSGKSSILKKLLNELSQKEKSEYLEISLANFDKNSQEEEKEQLIERSILQQIFYKVSKDKVPYSKLNRTENKSFWKILGYSSLFFVWIFSIFVYKHTGTTRNLLLSCCDISTQTILSISVIFILVTTLIIIYITIKGTGKIKLNKLSFQGVNLDIEENNEGSLLNQYIDEILYFFEATDYKVVIIEDLDRYDMTNIFQKLREINILLNSYEKIVKDKKKITFIYAVKDSIFKGEERTKFFEMIIPVIPIVNTNNAKDILINKFDDAGLLDQIGKPFLKDISYYIKDLRQLTNIFNEYLVYHESIDTKNQKELFSIIIYKNFFPKDFTLLHNRDGELYEILTTAIESLREKALKELTKQKDILKKEIKKSENEELESEELKLLFLSKILVQHDNLASFWYQNSKLSKAQLIKNEDAFMTYLKGGNLSYYYNLYSTTTGTFKNYSNEYQKRLEIIKNKILEKEGKLTKELYEIEQQIRDTKYAKIAQLLTDDLSVLDLKSKNDWSEEEKSNWKLIKHLIKNGYINENYKTYISYFHEGDLTQGDHDFIVGLKDNEPKSFEYKIDNTLSVIEELDENDFKTSGIENLDIAQYFFVNKTKHRTKRKIFISYIFENFIQEFIFKLVEKNIKNKSFLNSFISEIISDEDMKIVSIDKIFKSDILLLQEILIFIIDNLIHFKLSEEDKNILGALLKENIVNIYSKLNDKEKAKEFLLEQNVIFDEFSKEMIKITPLFMYIYEHNLYKFSLDNIKILMETIAGKDEWDRDLFDKAHLTTVRKNDLSYMVNYIDSNINCYYENVMNELGDNTLESEETLLYLLNHKNLNNSYKIDMIEKSANKLSNILDIENSDLWKYLFENNLIMATWDNVFNYYIDKQEFDEYLFKFLNDKKNAKELSNAKGILCNKYFEEHEEFDTAGRKLIKQILEKNEFENNVYKILIESYRFWYSDLDLSSLDKDKIEILIDTKRLESEAEVYDEIEEHCNECVIKFMEKYITEYINDEFNVEIKSEVFIGLIKSTQLSKDNKLAIIDKNDDFNLNELKEIVQFYIDEEENIPDNIFDALFKKEELSLKDKISILAYHIDTLDYSGALEYLNELGSPYSEILEKTLKNLKISFEENIWTIVQYMSEQGWIGKVKKSEKDNEIIINRREKEIEE